jgi:curved DNA-binding protein CbpA
MDNGYFQDVLGVPRHATREQVRQAYRRLVLENHPDRFPAEKKSVQELAVITLTEAYHALMSAPLDSLNLSERQPRTDRAPPRTTRSRGQRATPGRPLARGGRGVAAHRDPAYAYYKQGFINFSLAIHGIAEINRRIAGDRAPRFTRRYTAAEDLSSSLSFLAAAHGYFSRVVERHPRSMWEADARVKLRRIERFTALYSRILENLGRPPVVAR